jgi:hypothetical protein
MLSFLTACGTSQAPRIYTLRSTATPAPEAVLGQKEAPVVVGIGPVEIPDYLDQPQIITRTGPTRLSISEFDLWGGSLKEDVSRVLLENLSHFLNPSEIRAIFWKSYIPCSFRVPVTILRLDATRGGNVLLRARWALVGKDLQTLGANMHEMNITKPVKGNDPGDVVAAMSEALEELSKYIASDVKRFSAQDKR